MFLFMYIRVLHICICGCMWRAVVKVRLPSLIMLHLVNGDSVFRLNTQPIDLSSLSSQLMKGIPCLHLFLERLITGGLPDLPSFYVGPVNTSSGPHTWCRHWYTLDHPRRPCRYFYFPINVSPWHQQWFVFLKKKIQLKKVKETPNRLYTTTPVFLLFSPSTS